MGRGQGGGGSRVGPGGLWDRGVEAGRGGAGPGGRGPSGETQLGEAEDRPAVRTTTLL